MACYRAFIIILAKDLLLPWIDNQLTSHNKTDTYFKLINNSRKAAVGTHRLTVIDEFIRIFADEEDELFNHTYKSNDIE